MTYTDEVAIKALKNSDEKAYTWIYNKYAHPLRLYAKEKVGCFATARDIVQNLFANLWKNREKTHITESLSAYLYRGVHNHCLKHLEHIKVQRNHARRVLENSDFWTYDNNCPESILITKETECAIERAIDALPEQYRQILVMARLEGLSYEEIAEKVEIPVGSVGSQINRARKKLLEVLENMQ